MSAGDRDDERTDRDESAGGPPDGPAEGAAEGPTRADDADVWAAIVANYGERAVLDDEPDHPAPVQPPQPEPRAAVVEPDDPEDDEEEGYVPPPPPPAPRPRGVRGAAWCGVLLAPALLLLVAVTEIGPRWTPVVLVAWFLAGFGYLVATMPREPREPWDDGAQV